MAGDLNSLFAARFAEHAESVLVEAGGRIWTYREIDEAAGRLAARLDALGVEAGDRLLAQVNKSVEALLLYLATLRTGAIYLPLNTGYTESELAYFCGDAEPKLAVCRAGDEALFERIADGAEVTSLDDLFSDLPEESFQPISRDNSDIAAILYTSGTTGKPKGAMLSQGNLASNAEMLVGAWQFTADDVLVHALPIFHVHGLFVAIHCVLASGAKMRFLPKFESGAVLDAMQGATVLMGVPTFYIRLLAEDRLTREAASSMRVFFSGSAPLSADIHRAFEERTGHRVLERYGMTETGMLTSNLYHGERRPGWVGPPLPGVELRVASEDGDVLEQGETGIVEVRGPGIFSGYWRNPEKTKASFREGGWFITCDMGRVDETGFVQLVGRESDLIITGGLNVYPAEIESLLDDRTDIAEAAVIGVPHPDFGEAVVAVVRPGDGFDEDTVRAALRENLAAFKCPKRVIALEELPRNTMGKIQKKLLREHFAALFTEN